MTSFGFYAPAMGLLALLAAPLVLFYFLKLKRPRRLITSLVLWKQVLQDSRVNSPFQKFKRNFLLILQLLLLALAVLAATQPYRRAQAQRLRRLPVLVDCSASMAALDKPGGVSRLEEARARVRDIINGLLPDQEICLISFGRSARRLTDFTGNQKLLLDALAQIRVEDVPSDLEDALRMVQALGRTAVFDEVMLFTDGNLPEEADFELSFTLRYHRLAPGGGNLGITSLNARRSTGDAWDVFVRVEASAAAERASGAVELYENDALLRREVVSLAKGEAQRLVFRVEGRSATRVEARLVPDGFDALASDNRAWLTLPALRPLWIYVSPSLGAWRMAAAALPETRLFPDDKGLTGETSFDLAITSDGDNATGTAGVAFHVGVVPDAVRGLVSVGREGTSVVDWRRNAPLLQHVDLTDLVVLDDPRLAPGAGEGNLENLGFETLVHGTHGPLLVERSNGNTLDYYAFFHTDRSTLPYRVGFPVLVSNLARLAMDQSGMSEANAPATGVLPPVAGVPGRVYEAREPDGSRRSATAGADGRVSGIAAPVAGLYVLSTGGAETQTLGASLLSTRETSLAPVEEIRFSENLAVSAEKASARSDQSLWPLVAILGFVVLLVEWLYYHRSGGWLSK